MRIEGLTERQARTRSCSSRSTSTATPPATYFTSKLTPHAVTDFWEDLHDQGSHVEGGFCLLAETYGDDNPLTNLLR